MSKLKLQDAKLIDIPLSIKNLPNIIKESIQIAEKTGLAGDKKKKLAIKIVHDLITNSDLSVEEKDIFLYIVDNDMIEETIDVIIDATKHKLDINKSAKVGINCCVLSSKICVCIIHKLTKKKATRNEIIG